MTLVPFLPLIGEAQLYHSAAAVEQFSGASPARITKLTMNRATVSIPEKLFFKIGEVCDITDVQAHVLRYWESEFPMLAPQKNRAGQRTYRKRDVEMVLRIKELLYEDQYTIAGAKKKLTSELRGASKLKVVTSEMNALPPSVMTPAATTATPPPAGPTPSALSASPPIAAQSRPNYDETVAAAEGADTVLSDERRLAIRRLRQELRELLTLLDINESPSSQRK